MAVNKNALIRYKTIDKCLQNNFRKWTLDDLIDACSDALYEYEGKDTYVSKRTVQLDIQMMRGDKLGYNAPIVVYDRKYYKYEEEDFSITKVPLSNQDLEKLTETVSFLKQFQGFSHFKELGGMVQKLEDHVYAQKTNQKAVMDFEKNEQLKGLEFLDILYQAIIKKKAIKLTYQSFKARKSNEFNFHPYLLKEFRNRWFLIGITKKGQQIMNLALDRIHAVNETDIPFLPKPDFNAESYFKDTIGVSVSPTLKPQEVLLYITRKHAPYILTKPLHRSQKLISQDNYGVTISLNVQHNFELEKELLALGESLKVIAPERLKRSIKDRLSATLDLYNTDVHEAGLQVASKRLVHKGSAILNQVYTQREIRKMKRIIDGYLSGGEERPFAVRCLLHKVPELKQVLVNSNLLKIVSSIDKEAFLCKAIYFDKPPKENWYVSWHQDVPINVAAKILTDGYTGWTSREEMNSVCPPEDIVKNSFTIRVHLDDSNEDNGALRIISGSHNKRLSSEEIQLITSNSTEQVCKVAAGGTHLMKPLLLHASSKSKSLKRRRVIHLEFTSSELPNGLEWLEREFLPLSGK